jgi:catechol 2,3-dioxygenase
VDWYGKVVSTMVNFQDADNAWTSNDGANHRVAFLAARGLADDPDKSSHSGMHHSAFEDDSSADPMASYERVNGEGILPAFPLDHGLAISIYYEDPEGDYVELQADNFSDRKLSTEWMQTSSDFRSDPIGTFFDPEKVSQAFPAGEKFEALQPRSAPASSCRRRSPPSACPCRPSRCRATGWCRRSRSRRHDRGRRPERAPGDRGPDPRVRLAGRPRPGGPLARPVHAGRPAARRRPGQGRPGGHRRMGGAARGDDAAPLAPCPVQHPAAIRLAGRGPRHDDP